MAIMKLACRSCSSLQEWMKVRYTLNQKSLYQEMKPSLISLKRLRQLAPTYSFAFYPPSSMDPLSQLLKKQVPRLTVICLQKKVEGWTHPTILLMKLNEWYEPI